MCRQVIHQKNYPTGILDKDFEHQSSSKNIDPLKWFWNLKSCDMNCPFCERTLQCCKDSKSNFWWYSTSTGLGSGQGKGTWMNLNYLEIILVIPWYVSQRLVAIEKVKEKEKCSFLAWLSSGIWYCSMLYHQQWFLKNWSTRVNE